MTTKEAITINVWSASTKTYTSTSKQYATQMEWTLPDTKITNVCRVWAHFWTKLNKQVLPLSSLLKEKEHLVA